MHFFSTLSVLLFALAPFHAFANNDNDDEWDGHDGHSPRHGCLTDHSAAKLVSIFESFFVHIDTNLANKFLTPDFQLFSDSTNWATPGGDLTPGAVTAGSRQAFIQQELSGQSGGPQPNFTTLAVYHSCDSITFRWRLNLPTVVSGIDVLIVEPGAHMIKTDYSEYNNVALLVNFGCTPKCGN